MKLRNASPRAGNSTAKNVLVAIAVVGLIAYRAYSGGKPETIHAGPIEMEFGSYYWLEFEANRDVQVRIEAELTSGPAVEFLCLDPTNFAMFKEMIDSGDLSKKLTPVMELTRPNVTGKVVADWARLPKGKWAIIFDNSPFGRVSPPIFGDNLAKLNVLVQSRSAR